MPLGEHFEATDAQRQKVRSLSACGVPQMDIAKMLGISDRTLRTHFRHELDVAEAEANAKVAGKLFQNAMDGNLGAQIFWLKTRGRWRERDDETGQKTIVIYNKPGMTSETDEETKT